MNTPLFTGYRIIRKLGSGAMGEVYEAVDEMLERPVALKVLRPEIADQPELIERFRVEAVALARLHHPSIATLYAFFQQQGQYCMVMEFVRGHTLEALLAGSTRLELSRAVALMDQTLDGMAHAHGMGVMHRDIKPANIMITEEGAVKVTDFGIARILGSSRMTRQGRIIGTLEYIAPERIGGVETDFRSDLYSAGVVLFELLAGRLPFVSSTDYGLLQAHMREAPPRLLEVGVDCPPALEAVIQRALAKNPEERFQSCQEFRQALAAALPECTAGATRLAMPPTRLVQTPPPDRAIPKSVLWGAATVVLCFGAGGLAYFLGRPAAPVAPPQPAAPVVAQTTPPPAPAPEPVPPLPVQLQPAPPIVLQSLAPETPVVKPAPPVRREAPKSAAAPPPLQTPAPAPAVLVPPPVVVAAPPEPAPTPAPPPARPTPRRLEQVRKLFVAEMDDRLDEYLKEAIKERLGGHLRVVSRRGDADAVLSGGGNKRGGVGAKLSLGFKAGYVASVAIRDPGGDHILWSAEADDSRPGLGSIKRGGPRRVAEKLVESLRKAIKGDS